MERNKYIDGTIDDARKAGCDLVQLKLDGWWCRMVGREGAQTFYSETKRPFLTEFSSAPDCVLIGEYMRGTQWAKDPRRVGRYYVYDLISINGQEIGGTYAGRYALMRRLMSKLPPNFFPVQNYRIEEFEVLWKTHVIEQGFEGVVFRKSTDSIDATMIRQKREHTLEGVVLLLHRGEGKHCDRIGSATVQLKDGTTTSIGNGWSDSEREDMLFREKSYIGRTMEFKTNLIFASGNVRHGRFVRWRDDK